MNSCIESSYRKSLQRVAPAEQVCDPDENYKLYPTFPVPAGAVHVGFDALAEQLCSARCVRIDGYVGVLWPEFRNRLTAALARQKRSATWIDIQQALRSTAEIERLVAPSLGGDDPLFGTKHFGQLRDFFAPELLAALKPTDEQKLTILYGAGAGLVAWPGPLVYVDVPKNELQYRSRAGVVCNLGAAGSPPSAQQQYKRFYFVDWPVLNRHKQALLPHVDWFVDEQLPERPTFITGVELRGALQRMSHNVFRARPWFEAGPWGGQRLKAHIPQLPQTEPNYAWSFELITPENGIALGDGAHQCEVSFDWLMFAHADAVLGPHVDRFGVDFPIRFDFLDTFSGGNLSVQCHPRPEYALAQFGEPFTQDETYYIIDCEPSAEAYLGFRAEVDPAQFRDALEQSYREGTPVDVPRFVNTVPARRHELLLIPSGTIHCSGKDILVLEISATPYIFTFKMYDWLRLGLDGRPRPLNIQRAFDNLDFSRQGAEVARQLISRPETIAAGSDWRLVHLPTHAEHFYDVHRLEFATQVDVRTEGSPHVLMLVEGERVAVETAAGMTAHYNFLETFVVPAAADSYRITNVGNTTAKVVKAFLKPVT